MILANLQFSDNSRGGLFWTILNSEIKNATY